MRRYWTYALHAAGAAAFVLAVLFVAGLAVPFLADSVRGVRASLPGGGGDSGLIFVESPEVYTRQRLVNDRYLQDAWLRQKLIEIDDPDQRWIDTVRVRKNSAGVSLGKGEDEAGDRAQPELPDADTLLSFEHEFELQSNARDTIRQLILENALDDRHDLSGNTVFGLKFDTSVLPGSRMTLDPTVIVRMEADPLERLTQSPEDLASYYAGSPLSDPERAPNARLLHQNDGYFDSWRQNLEERLNGQLLIEKNRPSGANAAGGCADPSLYEALLDGPLCRDAASDSASPLAADAAGRLDVLFTQGRLVDDALAFELRIPDRSLTLGSQMQSRVLTKAADFCAEESNRGAKVRDLFERENPRITSETFLLPAPWEPLFGIKLNPRLTTSCGVDFDVQLESLEVQLFIVPIDRIAEVPFSVLQPLPCTASCEDAENPVSVWTQRSQLSAARSVLDPNTLEAIIGDAPQVTDRELCFTDAGYYTATPDPQQDTESEEDAAEDPEGEENADRCGAGRQVNFRIGAYQFLRRMTEVESYTYAAFPRGDVSGVVTETGSDRSAGAAVATPYGQAGASLVRTERERSAENEPSVINFASGDRLELFDFGWSIVKDGYKGPMIASQLVLVSVPAYVNTIQLDIIKGFMDVNRLPADWTERRAEHAALGARPSDEQRAELLEKRMSQIAESWELRTVRLKLPPDYEALDGIVIGNNALGGPSINESAFRLPCVDPGQASEFTLAIPGQRLWRSTVVTLGGEKATRIEVMPDMRGILATFGGAGKATTEGETGTRPRPTGPRELVVWTSEGRSEPVDVSTCKNGVP